MAEDGVLLAERTLTFGALKSGLLAIDGPLVTGDITVADLEFDFSSVEAGTQLVEETATRELLNQHRSWRTPVGISTSAGSWA